MTRKLCLILFLLLGSCFQAHKAKAAVLNDDAGPPIQFVSRAVLQHLKSNLQDQECQTVATYLAGKTPFPGTAQIEMQKYVSPDGRGFDCSKALDFWNYDLVPLVLFNENAVNQPRHIKRLLVHALTKVGPRQSPTVDWVKNLPNAEVLTDSNVGSIDKNLIEDDFLPEKGVDVVEEGVDKEVDTEDTQHSETIPNSPNLDKAEELEPTTALNVITEKSESPSASILEDVGTQDDKLEVQNLTPSVAELQQEEAQTTTVTVIEKIETGSPTSQMADEPKIVQVPIPVEDESRTIHLEIEPQPNPTTPTIPTIPKADLDFSWQDQTPHGGLNLGSGSDIEGRKPTVDYASTQPPTNQVGESETETQEKPFEAGAPKQEQDKFYEPEPSEPLSTGPSEVKLQHSTLSPTSANEAPQVENVEMAQEATPPEWDSKSKIYSTVEVTTEVDQRPNSEVIKSEPADSKDEGRIVGVITDADLPEKLRNLLLGNRSSTSTRIPKWSAETRPTRRGKLYQNLKHKISKQKADELKREELIRYISMALVTVLGLILTVYTCLLCIRCWSKRGPCSRGRQHRGRGDYAAGFETGADLIRQAQLTTVSLDGIQQRYNSTSGVVNSFDGEIYIIDENGNRVRRSRYRKCDMDPGVCAAAGLPVALVQPSPLTGTGVSEVAGHGDAETEV